ncbi:TetM/TetW/TetO/TetS family tetracycline resistance ribosomal protection protein [Planococcus sp. CPCC 101016]|uniref:elongation factor G n=1 Tax=Planococcus sp. CPCC 101016 TaxID=2599617 RepID=UPI0011B5C0D0|nr:TetM/TetW/TetO/TetS family tetracycline resistance ribosomal protection protein [Planococcus sp. CPCC 101016]TWT03332.1 TetM/TetW/TetO/TetS family tetracycline resistance ribosomal protection protein [Planococcus sp. CPCC 101016]
MNKTIGILAHVDAGKTTFSEQLLYHTKSIRQRGRVDHQSAFLDSHAIEKSRGITIFADQASFTFNGSTYFLIDTPGHVDFSPEMERSIQVMDYAIILISAVDGIEGHTETVWQLLQKHKVPVFFFINKTDREGADPAGVLEEIRSNFTKDAFDLTAFSTSGSMNEELIEFIAERNEELLNLYLDAGYQEGLWLKAAQRMIETNQLFPCASGSALQDIGVLEFLIQLDQLTVSNYSANEEFGAQIYKIRHDENGNRICYLKAFSGTLQVRDKLSYGPERIQEKVTQIRMYNGHKFQTVEQAQAGELFGIAGLTEASIGDTLGVLQEKTTFDVVPTLKSTVLFDSSFNAKEVLASFKILGAEDPSLSVFWDEYFQKIQIQVMGTIQLEVLAQVLPERFGQTVRFGKPEILYKETLEFPVIGYGHFEPLRHYAEVHLKLEPGERGSGFQVANACHADALSVGHQNLILHHLTERVHHGLLTGSPVTDMKATLVTGRGHNQHTSGGDFREASFRALRQGLEKAQNRLLEPMYRFKIKVDLEQMGKVLSDIQQAYGKFDAPETKDGKTMITGRVPVATFMNYSTEFASFTHGKGVLSLLFDGYDFCHNQEEVIDLIGYVKTADPLYTSTSIFCAKGQGYKVPWDEAEKAMHCL